MNRLALTAAALAVSAIALPAAAQTAWYNPTGWLNSSYIQLNGGTTTEGRVKRLTSGENVAIPSESGSMSDDLFGSALVGHNLTSAIALELEGVYLRNHYSYGLPTGGSDAERARRVYGGFANAKIRIPYTASLQGFAITPYVAGGIGYGNVEYDQAPRDGAGHDGFMWQGKAGLEIKTGLPVSFDVGYRYLEAPEYNSRGSFYSTNQSSLVRSNAQAVTLGARYSF